MKIYFRDQTNNFEKLLGELMTKPVMKFDKGELKEKITMIHVGVNASLAQINLDFLFNYRIFPPEVMSFMTQWNLEGRKMRVGDTILQQAFVPPVKIFSQKIIFGVRINRVIDETDRKGFSYDTIEGHVEKGESTFTMESTEAGLIFKIRTFSKPGNLLTRMLGPFFTVPYQAYCTRSALENVRKQIESGIAE